MTIENIRSTLYQSEYAPKADIQSYLKNFLSGTGQKFKDILDSNLLKDDSNKADNSQVNKLDQSIRNMAPNISEAVEQHIIPDI